MIISELANPPTQQPQLNKKGAYAKNEQRLQV